MVKKDDGRGLRGRAEEGERTRARLLDAAFETVCEQGYAATTARAIGRRAGVNQALVFYHFGGVDDLLLAALARSSAERLAVYGETLRADQNPQELIRAAAALFREDVEGGHVMAVTELIGASLARPELRAPLVEQMRPWLELVREHIEQRATRLGVELEAEAFRSVAFGLVSTYLGLNLLARLMPDSAEADALFDLLEQFAALMPGDA
jgi:AcrR family transcriptional regulator